MDRGHSGRIDVTAIVLSTLIFGASWTPPDIFVDNRAGDDRWNGQSAIQLGEQVGPVRTITRALRLAIAGTRVVLLPTGEPYHEAVTAHGRSVHALPDNPIILEGNAQQLIGWRGIEPSKWEYTSVGHWILADAFRVHAILARAGRPLAFVTPHFHGERPAVPSNGYALWDGLVLFHSPTGAARPSGEYQLSDLEAGLFIDSVSNLVVRNLTIGGFALDGVQIRGPARNIRFEGCRMADNGRSGIAVLGNGRATVSNSYLEGNLMFPVLVEHSSRLRLDSTRVSGDAVADESSRLEREGDSPKPLVARPIVVPSGYRSWLDGAQQAVKQPPAAPKEQPPAKNKAADKFFDE